MRKKMLLLLPRIITQKLLDIFVTPILFLCVLQCRFQITQSNNPADAHSVCDLAKNECALAVVLRDTSVRPWKITDTLTLTLQQSQTML
jgi:hypothetical protein